MQTGDGQSGAGPTATVTELGLDGAVRRYDAAAFAALVDAAAHRAVAAGAGPATLVIVRAAPTAAFMAECAGTWRVGATAVVVAPTASESRLAAQIRQSPWRHWPVLDAASPPERSSAAVGDVRGGRASGGVASGQPAYLLATGGSTGEPRLVPGPPLADAAVDAYRLLLVATNWEDDQRQLVLGPLYHAAPFLHAAVGMLRGNHVLLLEAFDASKAVEAIRSHQPEWMQLTPHQMQRIAAVRGVTPEMLASLRGVMHTAAPCPEPLKRRWIELLGPDRLFEMYSSTEAVGTTLVSGREWLDHPGTVGRGFGTQVRILGDAGEVLPPGQIGAVFMRSSRREAARVLLAAGLVRGTPNGFVSVGDRGWLDEAGYLYLAGRTVDVANVGGAKVDLHEVECVLREHPAVAEAAVAAVPDSRLGERAVAWVVLEPNDSECLDAEADAPDLRRWCRSRLPRAAVPRRVVLVDELPKTAAGKLDRSALKAMHA